MERILYGVIAAFLWCLFGAYLIGKGTVISNNLLLLTTAIVFAGAMAGGD